MGMLLAPSLVIAVWLQWPFFFEPLETQKITHWHCLSRMAEGSRRETSLYTFWIVFSLRLFYLLIHFVILKLVFVGFSGWFWFGGCFHLGSRMVIEPWLIHQPSSSLWRLWFLVLAYFLLAEFPF